MPNSNLKILKRYLDADKLQLCINICCFRICPHIMDNNGSTEVGLRSSELRLGIGITRAVFEARETLRWLKLD